MSTRAQATPIVAWLGLDVAKATFVAALDRPWQPGTPQVSLKSLPARSFARTHEGVRQCLEWAGELAGEHTLRVVMEATGNYSLELCIWLMDIAPHTAPAIVNPHQSARYLESRSTRCKDDTSDARSLARYGTERCPAASQPPSGARLKLREVLRLRAGLVAERDGHSNRLKAYLTVDKELGAVLRRTIADLDKQIDKCERLARKYLAENRAMAADVRKLAEIFSVGELTAMIIVAELGDLRRFDSARQLVCYCGLSPRVRESGTRKGQMRLSKLGNPHVRKALFMPALVTIRHRKTDLADWYHRKVDEGKPAMVMLTGLMRRLLERMYYVLTRGLTYERHPQTPQPRGQNL